MCVPGNSQRRLCPKWCPSKCINQSSFKENKSAQNNTNSIPIFKDTHTHTSTWTGPHTNTHSRTLGQLKRVLVALAEYPKMRLRCHLQVDAAFFIRFFFLIFLLFLSSALCLLARLSPVFLLLLPF